MKKLFLISLQCSIILSACSVSEVDVIGKYYYSEEEFTKDTIEVFSDGYYERRIYSIKTDSLIFKNKNLWKFNNEEDRIVFYGFLPNDNSEFLASNYDDVLLTSSMPVYKRNGIYIEESGDLNYRYIMINK